MDYLVQQYFKGLTAAAAAAAAFDMVEDTVGVVVEGVGTVSTELTTAIWDDFPRRGIVDVTVNVDVVTTGAGKV